MNQKARVAKAFLKLYLNKRIPLKVNHHVTYRCNLKCDFCKRRTVKTLELDTSQIMELMVEFKKMGTVYWIFNGGEPLLRRDIIELIEYAKKLNFHCTLISNGALISQKIDGLEQIDKILINILGPKKIEDKIKGKGHYETVIKTLQILSNKNISTEILTVLFNKNLEYLTDLITLAEKFKIGIRFQPIAIHEQDRSCLAKKYFPHKNEFCKTIDWLIEQKINGRPVFSSVEYLNVIKNIWLKKSYPQKCWATKAYCNITSDGYIVPCCARLSFHRSRQLRLQKNFKKTFNSLPNVQHCIGCSYSGPLEFNMYLDKIFNFFRIKF